MTTPKVPWTDLRPGEDAEVVDTAMRRVLDRGWFVLGPEVDAFETEFAEATTSGHTVTVASGTDALTLILRALGIGPGDEVILPSLTIISCASAIVRTGATPVTVDSLPDVWNMNPDEVAAKINSKTSQNWTEIDTDIAWI